MKKIKTKIKDLINLKGNTYFDYRGFLREAFKVKHINKRIIFSIVSKSKKNVIRGLHFQSKNPQDKLIIVLKGKILDVAIDLRKNSKTFGHTFSIILSSMNAKGLYIPAGFAHAYYSYEKENIIYYKLDNYYSPKFESGIVYNDTDIKINWPRKNMLISKKDKNLKSFKEFKKIYKYL